METELSFGLTTFLLWVPPFLSYKLWKQRIELSKNSIQTASKYCCYRLGFIELLREIITITSWFFFPGNSKLLQLHG